MKAINAIRMGGVDVLPIVEGGKGVSISTGVTSGHWAAGGGAGRSALSTPTASTRTGPGCRRSITAAPAASGTRNWCSTPFAAASPRPGRRMRLPAGRDVSTPTSYGRWAAPSGSSPGCWKDAKGLIHGLTCGAGMPYRLSDIAAKFNVHYYPIVSSSRAFSALWKRAYSKAASLLGGVVYEDPWLAGGHNGLSNGEDPNKPEDPFPRVLALRKLMRTFGLGETPIIMAGGVWWLEEWQDWIDNPELGPIAFQFGTRPLLTKESPIGDAWKQRLLTLKEGEIFLNRFSPTGFYSSAVNNHFIQDLRARSDRQVAYTAEPVGEHVAEYRRRSAQARGVSHARPTSAMSACGRRPASTRPFARPTARWCS